MKTFFSLLCGVVVVTAGCAMDKEAVKRIEQEQLRQSWLLAEQSSMLMGHSALLAKQIEKQQQMIDLLADIEHSWDEHRKRSRTPAAAEVAPDTATPEPTLVLSEEGKAVFGRNEWAWLELLGRNLKVRVDTGALSSSLNAVDLQPFERDGRDWIRFRLPDEEHPEGGEVYETPLVRHVKIRQASADELERRPVVRLKVRVGGLSDDAEFTLTNRENMLYPMLLGRNFLRDVVVVDVARKFVQKKYSPEPMEVRE
ncbi:ATP-dependent zinc protease family protein [Thiohalomonas denitrificans]|uniref:ATP-dependent zinc protease family protein n=1 Tax=Thiohalomonas denitrificans TaxID=415747 RepID=UPI0026E9BCC5|nr:ATP-dependent zinc protease [Thiohalomonas denitrificans]